MIAATGALPVEHGEFLAKKWMGAIRDSDSGDEPVRDRGITRYLVLRGWAAYFRNGTSSRKFTIIDSYVQERLATFDSAKHGRTGRNRRSHDKAWLERLGLYRLSKATHTVKAHA
jgi:hypothetical protein